MFTTIAISAASALAGLSIGVSTVGHVLQRRRLRAIEDVIETELISRGEISQAFLEISAMEQQREAAIALQLRQLQAQVSQLQPIFRSTAASGAFQQEVPERPASPSAAEVNALLTQQLSAINQRLQQVTGQQMPA